MLRGILVVCKSSNDKMAHSHLKVLFSNKEIMELRGEKEGGHTDIRNADRKIYLAIDR